MFLKTIKRQGEKIIELDKKNKYLRERNKELNTRNMILERFKNNTEKLLDCADIKSETYYETFKKIRKELDNVSEEKIKKELDAFDKRTSSHIKNIKICF